MNQAIQAILDKLDHVTYLAQKKPTVQVIRLVVQAGKWLSPADRNALIAYVQSKLSSTTTVSDFRPEDNNMTIYIAIPEKESLDLLKALRGDFKKTP